MVSDFVDHRNGYLQLTDAEYTVAKVTDPNIMQSAKMLLEYGTERQSHLEIKKINAQC